jgi:hypothetical protein
MTGFRSSFQHELDEIIQKGTLHLKHSDLFDAVTLGPDVEKLIEEVKPYLGDHRNPPPSLISTTIAMGIRMGPANEALGKLPAALAWYRVGRYRWRGGEQFTDRDEGFPDFGYRMTAGMQQMDAAICADRVGETDTAKQIFIRAVKNRSLSEGEKRGFDETKQFCAVWEWAIERAYVLLCLGEFQLTLEAGEEALRWIDKDRRAKLESATEMPLLILPTVLALARYELEPSAENRSEAIRRLDLDAVTTRIHVDHLLALFYLFNLRAKYPLLAQPADEELPPAARAQQAAEACRRWMAKAGIQLDGSVESLRALDDTLRQIYPTITDEEQRKLVLFILGSYFGDVVRAELAGGQWNISAAPMLSWTVDWELGEVELHLWPFQRVHEYATGKTDENLFDLWIETEQAYIEFGLAARMKDS